MIVNLHTIKDVRTFLKIQLGDLYDENEISGLSRTIIKTIFKGSGLHEIYNTSTTLNDEQSLEIKSICEELKTGRPYQYVTGETEFYNCTLEVTPAVLIPRPETEELTDLVIRENRDFSNVILDLGTGSGCIAIALKLNIPRSEVTGIDISAEALEVAGRNAARNNADINFIKNDIFNFRYQELKQAGIIVSNPPYVRKSEKIMMKRNVLDFEPHEALFVPDDNPLLYYKAILDISQKLLAPGGKIYFEINESFGVEMKRLLESYNISEATILKDINNKDRIAKGIKK